jgi:hypothetical protein
MGVDEARAVCLACSTVGLLLMRTRIAPLASLLTPLLVADPSRAAALHARPGLHPLQEAPGGPGRPHPGEPAAEEASIEVI